MDNSFEHTDRELFGLIAVGDEQAFSRLFNRWKHRVFTIARTHVENQYRSEEIVQDVFLKIWKNRAMLDTVEVPEAWIYRISRNQALNVLKQMARDPTLMNEDILLYVPSPSGREHPFREAELTALLQEGLSLLTPQQRKVFELSRLEKYSRDEIASIMDISKATVSVHLTIALRVMRAFFSARMDILSFILLLEFFFIKTF